MKNSKPVALSVIFCLAILSQCAALAAQSAVYTTEKQEIKERRDMADQVEAAIKVLSVIKQELEPEEQAATVSGEETAKDWPEALREMIQRLKRVWRVLTELEKEDPASGKAVSSAATDDKPWTSDISGKLDDSIKAMRVIKEELDAISREESGRN